MVLSSTSPVTPKRVVTDSMLGMDMPDIDQWSDRVTVVLGQNPGVFTGPGTNTYLIGTGSQLILLDTGQGIPSYVPLLDRALHDVRHAEAIQEIVLTHAHPDHMGGVDGIRAHFGALRVSKKPWPGHDAGVTYDAVDDGAVVTTNGATLRAVWTPGHARDHLCWYVEEEGSLFTGDVVLGAGTTVIPTDGDLGDYLASLRRILELDPTVIYPAHGPVIRTPRAKVEQYIAHRQLREAQIVDGLRSGLRLIPDLVKRIYTDVPEFLYAAAGVSVDAHLRKLEKDGVARRDGEEWCLT